MVDREAAVTLMARVGNEPGKSFRLKALDSVVTNQEKHGPQRIRDVTVKAFEQAAVAFSGEVVNRMFILEPSDTENRFDFGPFFVSGYYRVIEKINHPTEASKAWKAFRPR